MPEERCLEWPIRWIVIEWEWVVWFFVKSASHWSLGRERLSDNCPPEHELHAWLKTYLLLLWLPVILSKNVFFLSLSLISSEMFFFSIAVCNFSRIFLVVYNFSMPFPTQAQCHPSAGFLTLIPILGGGEAQAAPLSCTLFSFEKAVGHAYGITHAQQEWSSCTSRK